MARKITKQSKQDDLLKNVVQPGTDLTDNMGRLCCLNWRHGRLRAGVV